MSNILSQPELRSRRGRLDGLESTFLEEGAALSASGSPDRQSKARRKAVLVIGGGQAGLSVGYHLRRLRVDFAILDAADRIGDAWRHRWDSLRLFSPARYDGLDGMPFPAPADNFPTKDEMADYLETYARRFALPVVSGAQVESLYREGDVYIAVAGGRRFEAEQVIIAMSNYQVPRLPAFAKELNPAIRQLHAKDYRSREQLIEGDVLIVGAGNSGAEIAKDIGKGRQVHVAGPATGEIPFKFDSFMRLKVVMPLLFRVIFRHILTVDTPIGRKVRPKIMKSGTPLIRLKSRDLAGLGVKRTGRVVGVQDGQPKLEDGAALRVANIIWCTGFEPGFSWIRLPGLMEDGEPRHQRGVAVGEPGLCFVGLHFLTAMTSAMVGGVGRDARRIAELVAQRVKARSL